VPAGLADRSVRLSVFDMLGRKVATLLDRRLDAGLHSLRWDGTDANGKELASGLYVYRVEAGGEVLTGKLVVSR